MNNFWEFMFTKQHILINNQDTSKEWQIRVETLQGNFSDVIFSNSQITLINKDIN